VKRNHPGAAPVPLMITGFTDAYAFSQLGAVFYGFAPVQFPADAGVTFWELYHGHDERIPVAGFKWGLRTLHEAVTAFCT
jgi:acetylornithine deacetylase/succinyl-diaminopimelate desuccinylase-like protein